MRAHQDVVDRQLLLARTLGNAPLLLLAQLLRESKQLVEDHLHILRAGVVFGDHRLELLQVFGGPLRALLRSSIVHHNSNEPITLVSEVMPE